MKQILLVDDEKKLRGLLARILSQEGFAVTEAGDCATAWKKLETGEFDLILCDVRLPDGTGIDFTKKVKEAFPSVEVILLTAYGNIQDGIQAMKYGAFDYLIKADENEKIIPVLHRAIEKTALQERVRDLEKKVGKKYSFNAITGRSKALTDAVGLARKVAATDTTVLLLGETGTGKEVFANAIHQESPRSGHAFVAINCSAFSRDLFENELFGHKAGAFTGAGQDSPGLLVQADKGTLFLDEIGEMPPEIQPKLLRVIETGEFNRLGDNKPQRTNIRIIAATNRDLSKDVAEGKFREDLYYRLSVFQLRLPALRERPSDIALLAAAFVPAFAVKMNKPGLEIGAGYLETLEKLPWKGNIRELRNVIERSVIIESGSVLTAASLPGDLRIPGSGKGSAVIATDLASMEKQHIGRILQQTGGNKTETARLLNIGLTTLYRKIEEYQLAP